MPKPTVDVEWTIVESDAEWERLQQRSPPTIALATDQVRYRNRLTLGMMALLCVLALLEAWGWFSGGSGQHQALQEPAASAPMTVDKAAAEPTGLLSSPIDPQIDAAWQVQFRREDELLQRDLRTHEVKYQVLYQQGDQQLVEMIISTSLGRQRYRQTRFYERTLAGWRRSVPAVELWGAEQSLETPSFVFQFRQHDAPVVIAVAAPIELFYTTWRQRFDLPFTTGAKKLAIEVSAIQRPGRAFVEQNHYARFGFDPPDRLLVASPALYLVPGGLTENDLLAQSLTLPLFDDLLRQASAQHHIDAAWQPMLNGIYLWQVWDSGLPLAAWQDEVVTWLYLASANASAEQPVILPKQYEELCAAHKLWLTGPTYLGIPLLCTNLDREGWYRATWGPHKPLTHLDQFSFLDPSSIVGSSFPVSHPAQTVALATLVDYAVAAYGQEHLPVLVAGLGQHKSWSTLIPAVYGVTPAEFKAGWQKHLVTQYGLFQETIAHQ